jgi:hypothetical protein
LIVTQIVSINIHYGARQLFHHMGLTSYAKSHPNERPSYQFFDLGSGGGRLVIQSHLELPAVFKSVGIELFSSRHKIAAQTWDDLTQNGDASRIRTLAEKSWGIEENDKNIVSTVDLYEGDLFELDISQATHIYVSSLCFSEDMMKRLAAKIELEGISLQMVASLRPFPSSHNEIKNDNEAIKKRASLGSNPWIEYIEMSWTKARGDGCPVYFYSVKHADKT